MGVTAETVPWLESNPDVCDEGVYLTDGHQLFRLISPQLGLYPSADLENCLTLSVERYYSDELYAMSLQRVHASV